MWWLFPVLCILYTSIMIFRYTLLVGKPPFETDSLKDTYQRIKRNEYRVPSHISSTARSLITRLLRADPASRPTPLDILQDPFLTVGFVPTRLPHRWYTKYIYATYHMTNECYKCAVHWPLRLILRCVMEIQVDSLSPMWIVFPPLELLIQPQKLRCVCQLLLLLNVWL